jgi:hypothetical protein
MVATKVKIHLRSIVPILFDRYSGVSDGNDEEAKKNASQKVYLDDGGKVCLPSNCLKASIREASSDIGKKMESKKRRQRIRAGLFFMDDMIPLADEADGIHAELVTRGVGSKVTRVVSYRPYLKVWECKVDALLYDLTPENVRQYIELAGMRYGVCAHRPEWGRFELVAFDIEEEG